MRRIIRSGKLPFFSRNLFLPTVIKKTIWLLLLWFPKHPHNPLNACRASSCHWVGWNQVIHKYQSEWSMQSVFVTPNWPLKQSEVSILISFSWIPELLYAKNLTVVFSVFVWQSISRSRAKGKAATDGLGAQMKCGTQALMWKPKVFRLISSSLAFWFLGQAQEQEEKYSAA